MFELEGLGAFQQKCDKHVNTGIKVASTEISESRGTKCILPSDRVSTAMVVVNVSQNLNRLWH